MPKFKLDRLCQESGGGGGGGGGNKAKAVTSFFKFDRAQCDVLKIKQKLPGIYRGTKVSLDPKGRNFSVVQTSPSFADSSENRQG